MAKLSEQKKVELLETAVANNDVDAVNSLFVEHGEFEFTARALGQACRTGDENLVRALCENGASFRYDATSAMVKKYDCKIYVNNYDSILRDYSQMIIVGVPGKNSKPEPAASGIQRKKNLAVLWEYRDAVGLDGQELLYWALLWQDGVMVSALNKLGATTLSAYRADLAAGRLPHNRLDAVGRYDRNSFSGAFRREPAMIADFVLGFAKVLGDEPIHLFKSDVMEYDFQKSKDVLMTKLCSEPVFFTLVQNTDFGTVIKKRDILYALVDENNATGLAWALEQGWAEEKDEKALLKYAQKLENVTAPVMALLLNRNNPEDTPVDDLPLSVIPSAAELKKIWATKKLEDGSLMITGYKGEALDVVIPDKIGKIPVTALSSDVFNPKAPRVTREQAEIRQNLRSVEVCGSVGSIPGNLFGCIYGYPHWTLPNLKRVVLDEGIREIGRGAFMGCTGLEEVVFPQSLTTLEYGVFYNCTVLQTAQLPQGVLKIGSCAFYNCKNLKQVSLPETAVLENNSFSNCIGLQDEAGMVILGTVLYNYYGSAPVVTIPYGITIIGSEAFRNNQTLERVILPHGLKEVCGSAFSGCTQLRELDIPEGIKELSAYSFENCTALEELTIPAGTKKLCSRAFAGCQSLVRVVLPMGLEEIHSEVFANCITLKEIHIPDSVKTIGDRFHKEFWNCDQLVIYGKQGSYAETYAKENNIPFVAE